MVLVDETFFSFDDRLHHREEFVECGERVGRPDLFGHRRESPDVREQDTHVERRAVTGADLFDAVAVQQLQELKRYEPPIRIGQGDQTLIMGLDFLVQFVIDP